MANRPAPVPKAPKPRRAKNIVTGITLIGQMPAAEHVRKGHAGYTWRLWLSYNDDYSTGVYLELNNDGSIWRYSVVGGRIVKGDEIKDKD